jgi:hypothetical protein
MKTRTIIVPAYSNFAAIVPSAIAFHLFFFGPFFGNPIMNLIDEPVGTTKFTVLLISTVLLGILALAFWGVIAYALILIIQAFRQPTLLQKVDPASYAYSNDRLQKWDFSKHKVYLIQAVTFENFPYLGKLTGHSVHLNLLGNFVKSEWLKLHETKRNGPLTPGAFTILPTQFKAIIVLDAEEDAEELLNTALNNFHKVAVDFVTKPWGFKKRRWTKGFSKIQIQNTEDFIKIQDEIIFSIPLQ